MKDDSTFNKWFNLFVFVGMAVAIVLTTMVKFGSTDTGHIGLVIAAFGSIMGILSVLCSANARILTFLFGVFDVSIYAVMCFMNWKNGGAGLGNALVNACYFLPMQFVGYFQWKKRGAQTGTQVSARRLNASQRWIYTALFVAGTAVVYFILAAFDKGAAGTFLKGAVLMDAISMVCNILGQLLLSTAYMEQWIFWILVNVTSVAMWVITLRQSSDTYSAIYTVKYAFYLLNSINGLRIWIKISKRGEFC